MQTSVAFIGPAFNVEAESPCDIAALKRTLQKVVGIPTVHQRLVCAGDPAQDDLVLASGDAGLYGGRSPYNDRHRQRAYQVVGRGIEKAS